MVDVGSVTSTTIQTIVSIIRYKSQVLDDISTPGAKIISLEEASWHYTQNDCWVVIYDRVYDITNFIKEHPGGIESLIEHAGRDATVAFRGSGHSAQAMRILDKYFIGELPLEERIFRKKGGYKLSDMPA